MKKKRLSDTIMDPDPFSQLPDPIIHHVMSFLTNSEITKFSILSKRFFSLWNSYPVIDFDQSICMKNSIYNTNDFINHIHNSMIRRSQMDTDICEFRIKTKLNGSLSDDYDLKLDFIILIALENRVRFMDLNLGFGNRYSLLSHNNNKFASIWIKVLRLQGMKLDFCHLIKVCTSLEIVYLSSCRILQKDVKVYSETLTDIEFIGCSNVISIQLNAPNLYSFLFDSGRFADTPCEIDLSKCENIVDLSLTNIISGRDWIEDLVDNSRKLKTFILNGCNDIESFRVWNEKLEILEISSCPLLGSIDLLTRSLTSFVYNGTLRHTFCDISFVVSKYIKELSIESALITDDWLETQIATLESLESLRLKGCSLLKNIRVFHEKLRNLELCLKLVEVDIETPELVSFVYEGGLIEVRKIVTQSNCNATLSMSPYITYNNETYVLWRNMLSYFGHCQSLKLICSSKKDLMIPEELREKLVPPLYDLQHMEIQIESLQKIDRDLVDYLLWLSPLPKTLHIFSNPTRSSLQMIIKIAYNEKVGEVEEDKDPFCCINRPIKCWKHSLTSLEIHSSEVSPRNGLHKYFSEKTKMPVHFVSP